MQKITILNQSNNIKKALPNIVFCGMGLMLGCGAQYTRLSDGVVGQCRVYLLRYINKRLAGGIWVLN